jgi:hypothetical protein
MDITDFTTKEQIMNHVNVEDADRHLCFMNMNGEDYAVLEDYDEQIAYYFLKVKTDHDCDSRDEYEFYHENEMAEFPIDEE